MILGSSHNLHGGDYDQAREEANTIFQAPGAIKYLLLAAEAEVSSIIREHQHIIRALADELQASRTLYSAEIDAVISRAQADHDAVLRSPKGAAIQRMWPVSE